MNRSILRTESSVISLLSLVAFTPMAQAESTRIESDRATSTTNPNTVGAGVGQVEFGVDVGLNTYSIAAVDSGRSFDVRSFGGSVRAKYGAFDNLDLELTVGSLGEHRRSESEITLADGSTATELVEETAHVSTWLAPGVKIQILEGQGFVPALSFGLSTILTTSETPWTVQSALGVEWEYDDFVRFRLNLGGGVFGLDEELVFGYDAGAMLALRLLAVGAQRVDLFLEASFEPNPVLSGLDRRVFGVGALYQVSEWAQLDLTIRSSSIASDGAPMLLSSGVGATLRW